MNSCLCIGQNISSSPLSGFSPSYCNNRCEDYLEDIHFKYCGGENAYNIYEIQGVEFNSKEMCLSLQCQLSDIRFIPMKCSNYVGKICQTLGLEIKEEQRETFVECQMCAENNCSFRRCTDLLASSIYCESISDTSTSILNHSTSKELLFGSSSTSANLDEDKITSSNDTLQISGVSDELVLEISLPLILGVITLLLCAMGVVLYKRRSKMAKTDGTPKVEIDSLHKKNVYSELDFDLSNPSFAIEHCYQQISNLSNPSNERSYNNSEQAVDDHLRDKQAKRAEVDIIYQNASTGIN